MWRQELDRLQLRFGDEQFQQVILKVELFFCLKSRLNVFSLLTPIATNRVLVQNAVRILSTPTVEIGDLCLLFTFRIAGN